MQIEDLKVFDIHSFKSAFVRIADFAF